MNERATIGGWWTLALCVAIALLLSSRSAAAPGPGAPVSVVQTTSDLSQALTPLTKLHFTSRRPAHVPVIAIDDGVRYQRFTGIGAAMTDSSAWLISNQLSPSARARLMGRLFGSAGIHLNFLRVPIGSSDFAASRRAYSYDDRPAGDSDPTLAHFSIAHDLAYVLPALRQARRVDPGLQLLANPWSPPAWMKDNDSLNNVGARGALRPSAYGPLAGYLVKFLEAYAAHGVPVQAITPQNEPGNGFDGTTYPGLTFREPEEARFISDDLTPALAAAGLRVKLYGNDGSWSMTDYATNLARGAAGPDLAGMAWHCYFGGPGAMTRLHLIAPGLDQIVDECSPELTHVSRAEYLISSLRNWASAVTLWNLALDPHGGPKVAHSGCPGCTGVVTIDERTHTARFGAPYYQLGQLSAFVRPGATRIASQNFVGYSVNPKDNESITPGLDDVAFENPDGTRVLVTYNNSSAPITFGVSWHGRFFTSSLAARAMATFTWAGATRGSRP